MCKLSARKVMYVVRTCQRGHSTLAQQHLNLFMSAGRIIFQVVERKRVKIKQLMMSGKNNDLPTAPSASSSSASDATSDFMPLLLSMNQQLMALSSKVGALEDFKTLAIGSIGALEDLCAKQG